MPGRVRAQYKAEVTADYEDMLLDAGRRGTLRSWRVGIHGLFDLAARLPMEWWRARRSQPDPSHVGRVDKHATLGWGERAMNLMRELKLAARALLRRPGYAAIAALTLALGIGANTAIFTVVDAVLISPLPYPDSDRLVTLRHHAPGIDLPELEMSDGLLRFYQESADFLESIAVYDVNGRNLTGGDQPAQVQVLDATPSLIEALRVVPAMGRPINQADAAEGAAPVAMLTDIGWRTRFGQDPDILGRLIELDGVSTEIVGVLPAGFAFPDEDPTALVPMRVDPNGAFGAFGARGIARLAPGVSHEQGVRRFKELQSRLSDYFGQPSQEFFDQAGWDATLPRLRDAVVADIQSTLWIVLGTVGLVLLIACANVANLFLVRAEGRQKEMAIRTAMGAGKGAVAASFLSESLLLGLGGGVVGVVLAWVGLEALLAFGPEQIPRLHEISLGVTSLGFATLLSVLAGLAFGSLPLLRYAGNRLAGILRDGGRTNTVGRDRHRARNALVASQLALALVLLVGSGLMLRSFAELRAIDPGFDPEGVLTVGLSRGENEDLEAAARFYQDAADRVAALPGVESVGITTRVPLLASGSNGGSFEIENRVTEENDLPPVAMYRAIGPDYFNSLGIRILQGRDVARSDWEGGPPVVWVNQTLADDRFDGDPIGERIRFDSGEGIEFAEIVGVVENTKEFELSEEEHLEVYLPLVVRSWPYPGLQAAALTVRMADGQSPTALVPSIRRIVNEIDPRVPLTSTRTMDEVVAGSMASTSFTMALLGIATGVALLLGAIGLFGVISYVVSQRTREIGVRVALGAQAGAVSGMIVKQGLSVTVVGTAIGLAAAFALTRVMQALLYDVSATDPATFAVAAALLVAVSLAATWLPARRAARVDPIEALRAE